MSIRLEFDIEFKSDYHVGAGHGLGQQVDSALLRDPDAVPVIRGTVITGLLRDSLANLLALQPFEAERLCQASRANTDSPAYCGQHAIQPDRDCPVCAIFGSPRRMKRWHISSARPAALTVPQQPSAGWRAGQTAAQVATRVRINPRTRRAEDNKLFTREEGDGSLHFRFTAECLGDSETDWREAEWLVAAARLLRNLGAGKRRGYGECDIHLVDRGHETELIERVDDRLKGNSVNSAGSADKQAVTWLTLPADPGTHSYRLRVLLRTDEPLLIARRAEAGNQFETLETIPGSVLRGALAWRLARRYATELADPASATYSNFAALFFRDALRFSTLLPVEANASYRDQGYPTITAPRDFLTCELHPGYAGQTTDKGHGVWSMARGGDPSHCPECAKPDRAREYQAAESVKLESLNGFVSLVKGAPRSRFKPQQTVEMHIRIDPASGRVRRGDLFGYVSLEPGQYFVGEITCADEAVWKSLQQMAGLCELEQVNDLRLGKAGRRGHGKASVVFQPATQSPWHGPALKQRVASLNEVVLLLLSDAIVTDPWGRFQRGFDTKWIQRELKLPETCSVSIDRNSSGDELAFCAVRPVDAFNAQLGLPRARDMAMAAGSSVRLSFSGIQLDGLLKLLAAAESQGIGLRRDEGFGRVAFNHPVYGPPDGWDQAALKLSPLSLANNAYSHSSANLLRFVVLWSEHLDRSVSAGSFRDGRFEAVARVLHASRRTSVDAVKQDLRRMGSMEELIGERLNGRDKKNFFESDGKEGMENIDGLLDSMALQLKQHGLLTNAQAWQIGVQMLAERIAQPARQKAQEGR